jgi:hypothetical protein
MRVCSRARWPAARRPGRVTSGDTRSLDSIFGLDQEALRTVKQWRFRPGTRLGQAVPVLVVIELAFTLR